MTARMRRSEPWAYFEHLLTNAVEAEKGHVACIDLGTGSLTVAAAADADLFPIGYFDEDKTGTGTNTVRVQLFEPIMVHVFTNEGADVAAANVGSICYLAGANSVDMTDTNAIAGRVWQRTATQVWVQMAVGLGPQGIQGIPG